MPESTMRATIVRALRPLDAQSIEVKGRAGVPDINFVGGWMECKFRPKWAKDCDVRPVVFPHNLSKEQIVWLTRRARRGGVALLAAKVYRSWFFWNCRTFDPRRLGKITRPEMIESADRCYLNNLDKDDLLSWIRSL